MDRIEFIDANLNDTVPWFIDILVLKGRKMRDKLASFLDKRGVGTSFFIPTIHTTALFMGKRELPECRICFGKG
ncbi:hypothetical protein Asulf_00052 [Archaeoglobus sulfaticallidus PM70-1]|uniref:Uncharacterized protein n=1 Tax=Archaeoglobus sulfaticallidus PM70-1 TaxID=387631 RepID=N0BAR8_9EURY|nr:hypothetical protein [Archaeoglobus sulfaticallidus]AGK60088.1 hypothetical protein Asulf_00052 [Archaeoglobus sulfaticallidus PM70-1]